MDVGYVEKYDLCPLQDVEVCIDCCSVVMWDAFKMSHSPIGGANIFSCPPESVDKEMCRAGTFFYK